MAETQSFANHAHTPKLFLAGFLAWVTAFVCHVLMALGYHAGGFYTGAMLVAVDGGYRACRRQGLTPDWSIGDWDSLGRAPAGPV